MNEYDIGLALFYLLAATAIPYYVSGAWKEELPKPKKYGQSIRKKRMLRKRND